MSSAINPNSINNQYPVAGQDNNSQGFRDNFTAIKNNLDHAKNEISDLQAKAVLKAPLAGETTVSNTMTGVTQSGVILKDLRETTKDLGTFTAASTINVVYSDADFQRLVLGGAIAMNSQLAFAGFPPSGQYAKLRIEVTVANVDHILTLPTATYNNLDGLYGFDSGSKTFTFPSTGVYLFEFASYNAGSTLTFQELTRRSSIDSLTMSGISTADILVANNLSLNVSTGRLIMSQPVPATSVGAVGDEQGMFAIDENYIYFCVAAYDGLTDIWSRTALSAVGAW